MRRAGSVLALAVALALAGCGDDDENGTAGTATEPRTERTAPAAETETAPTGTATTPEKDTQTAPEEQPGGAGDEEPARSQASFTGRGGRLRPRVVRVAPFIAIRVELRSADGADYGLRCAGKSVRVDRDIPTASTTLEGRRPGERVACRPLGDHNRVVLDPSGEPGP